MRTVPVLFALLLLGTAAWPRTALAQVKRCVAADGILVYTDRRCEDIGARERPAVDRIGIGNVTPSLRMCARSVQDLSLSLGSAIGAGDVNALAGLYDWTGMGSRSARSLMDRLGLVASRTLVDVQPVYSGGGWGDDVVAFDPDTGALLPARRQPARLIGLRVDQVLANGSTPARVNFGLRRRMGCWWLHW